MSTDKCEPHDDACVEAAFSGGFPSEEPPCDNYGGAPCYYFHIGSESPRNESIDPREHCTVPTIDQDLAAPGSNRPCGRDSPGWFHNLLVNGHWARWGNAAHTFIRARSGVITFGYNDLPFKSKGEPTYMIHFDPLAVFEIDACCNEQQCETNPTWIGRVRWLGGGIPWEIWCNIAARVTMTNDWPGPDPPNGDPRWCRQSIFRPMNEHDASINLGLAKGGTSFSGPRQLPYSSQGLVSILSSQGRGHCFPYVNWYCFVANCGGDPTPGDRKFVCIEDESPRVDSIIGSATGTLEITYSMRLSTKFATYPHRNKYERHLQNTLLEFFALKSSGEISHSVTVTDPDTIVPFTWVEYEIWDEEHPDGVEYPVVEYAGSAYPGKPNGWEISLTGRSFVTGIKYPMELRLISALTTVELLVEKEYDSASPVGTHKHRLFANVIVKLVCQVWLKPEAYEIKGPFKFFKDITEPWDYRFADPKDPNKVYTLDYLIVQGPNGERVHSEITWLGRICEAPIGLGSDFAHPCSSWLSSYPVNNLSLECCSALQTVDGAVIPGQLTNISNAGADHLFTGNVALVVPGLNTSGELYADCGCTD